jgi:hypothetical protein
MATHRHQAAHPSPIPRQLIDREATMSKLTRTLILGATLTAMHLVGMTAVAQAQATNEGKDARRPPSERQVGESWRHHQVAPESQTTTDPAAQRALARQRYWYHQSTLTSRQQTAQEQTAADAALQRQLARERFSIPSGTPAQAPAPVRSTEPGGQPDWLVLGLGVLAAILALVAGVAVMAARRAGRKVRPSQAT